MSRPLGHGLRSGVRPGVVLSEGVCRCLAGRSGARWGKAHPLGAFSAVHVSRPRRLAASRRATVQAWPARRSASEKPREMQIVLLDAREKRRQRVAAKDFNDHWPVDEPALGGRSGCQHRGYNTRRGFQSKMAKECTSAFVSFVCLNQRGALAGPNEQVACLRDREQ